MLLQVVLVVNPDCAALGACLSPWDDNLMAVAGPHIVKAYRFDNRTGTSKASNVLMLVRTKVGIDAMCLAWLGFNTGMEVAQHDMRQPVAPTARFSPLWRGVIGTVTVVRQQQPLLSPAIPCCPAG